MSNCGLNSATASGLLFTPWLNDIFGPHFLKKNFLESGMKMIQFKIQFKTKSKTFVPKNILSIE